MDAYTSNYFTHGTSETLKKLYCLNFIKKQEHVYKKQQKTFHIPFAVSTFADTDKIFPKMFYFKHTKQTQTHFEQLALFFI